MNPDIFLSPKANSYNGSNDTKIIRSSLDQFYLLPKDEIVTTFVVGSQILTKNQSDTFTKTIQQKVSEQWKLNLDIELVNFGLLWLVLYLVVYT